jgi:hypothetical protein
VTSLSSEDLDVETLLACLSECSDRPALRPEYDARSLRWLLEFLVPARGEGSLHKALVRDAAGQVLGWYLYYAGPAGLGEAIHIGARHESIKAVLEHLFEDAWRRASSRSRGDWSRGSQRISRRPTACSILASAGCWSSPATRRCCRLSIAGTPCSRVWKASGACDFGWSPGERASPSGTPQQVVCPVAGNGCAPA